MIPQNLKDKLLKFDDGAAYDASFKAENICFPDSSYFKSGARWQHSRFQAVIEKLITIVEIQSEALNKIQANDFECDYITPYDGELIMCKYATEALDKAAEILKEG